MNTYKAFVAASALFAFVLVAAGPSVPVQAAPQPTIQTERHDHPNIVHAIDAMNAAIKDMNKAPDDFGGNKAAAINDTKQAVHSLKKALYYRLKMDDAAIDKAP